MRRKPFVVLFALFITFSAAAVTGVQASTNCEKWLTDYKAQLAKSKSARHLSAAKKKIVRPKRAVAKVLPARFPRPKMSHEELMRRFQLACGDLPDTEAPPKLLAENDPPKFVPPTQAWYGDDGVMLAPDEYSAFLPNLDSPVYTSSSNIPPDNWGGSPSGAPFSGGIGGPGGFGGGGGKGGSGTGSSPCSTLKKSDADATSSCGGDGTTPITVTAVPEPSSWGLVLAGLTGSAGLIRRRFGTSV